ncbi:flippase [Kocuria sp. CPCC 205292]|uniref:flippase n=1 Tax=Kocuria cellulosilytica TaxID=3071451 RepID=UPI0034D71285
MLNNRARRDATYLFVEKVGQLLAVAVVNVVLLRELGPSIYGYLGAATSILAIAMPLSTLGHVPVVRSLSSAQKRSGVSRGIVSFGVRLTILGCVLGATVMLTVALLAPAGETRNLIAILSFSFLARPFWGFDAWYKARSLNHRAAVIRLSGILISGIGRLIIAVTTESLWALAVFVVLEHAITGILFAIDYRRTREPFKKVRANHTIRKDIIRSSVPMFFSSLAVMLYMRADQPMLLYMTDSAQVGLYSAAANLSDSLAFIPTIVSTLFMPAAFKLYEISHDRFFARMRFVLGLISGIGYIIVICGWFASPFVIALLYGEAYNPSAELLQILLFSVPFVFVGVIQGIWVAAARLHRFQLIFACLAAFINIGLNFYLIPIFGATGAACSTVLAHATASCLGNFLFKETRPIAKTQLRALDPFYATQCVYRQARNLRR